MDEVKVKIEVVEIPQNWKSAEEVLRIKKHLNDHGINYLLNIGPDGLGRIPVPAIEIFKKIGALSEEKQV